MVHSKKTKIAAFLVAICMVFSMLTGMTLSVGAAAIDDIKEYAANDDATGLDKAKLVAAGVAEGSVIDANMTEYGNVIAAKVPAEVDTAAELQAIVHDVNMKVAVKGDATGLTNVNLLTNGGVSGAVEVNRGAYITAFAAKADGDKDTLAEIQAIVNKVNGDEATAAINKIKGYVTTSANDLTVDELKKAGVANINASYLDKYKEAIDKLANDQALLDTLAEIQTLVNGVNQVEDQKAAEERARLAAEAIAQIKEMAANDDASALTIELLGTAGVRITGDAGYDKAIASNLSLYQKAIRESTASQVDEISEIKSIIYNVNKTKADADQAKADAIAAIKGYAANDNASTLTIAQLLAVGISESVVMSVNLPEYKKAIEAAPGSGADSDTEIENIIISVNSSEQTKAINKIKDFANNDNANDLTIDLLTKAGVPTKDAGASVPANLQRYKDAIKNASGADVDSSEKIKTLVNNVNTAAKNAADAIATIEGYKAGSTGLNRTILENAEITNINDAYMNDYQKALNDAATGAADTREEIQAIINSVNNAKELANKIDAIAKDTAVITIDYLKSIGVQNTIADNLQAYIDKFLEVAEGDSNTLAKIQKVINDVNAVQAAILDIRNYAANDDASELTMAKLELIGISNRINANLAAYKKAIADAKAVDAETKSKIQTIIDNVNTTEEGKAINKIKEFIKNDNASGLTPEILESARLAGVRGANLEAYKKGIVDKTNKDNWETYTKSDIENIIDQVNDEQEEAAVAKIRDFAANDNANALTIDLLKSTGINAGVIISRNLEAYKAAIVKAISSDVDTVGEVQALLERVNAEEVEKAIDLIEKFADENDASQLTMAILEAAGLKISGNDAEAFESNLPHYKVAIAATTKLGVDTIEEIRQLITDVNAAVELAANIEMIKGYAANNNASGLTKDLLTKIGITYVEANLDTYKVFIANANPTDVDTKEKIQSVINSANQLVNAVNAIKGYAGADDANDLTVEQLKTAGVTNIISANLDAYKSAIAAAAADKADTTAEIQTIINDVNTQQRALAVEYISLLAANDMKTVTIDDLIAAGVKNAISSAIEDYKIAIANATLQEANTTEKIQAIIDAVNAKNSAASISEIKVGTVEGSIPVGSIDPSYLPVINVTISNDVTEIVASNFTFVGSALLLYTSNNFASPVSGIAITENTTPVYIRVVSADASSNRYYKVVFNKVSEDAKYAIAAPNGFVAKGTNLVATVSIDRNSAVALANPKLFVAYTLEGGVAQIFQTLDVTGDTKDVVISQVGFEKVLIFLVDGDVDWSQGQPLMKSNFISISVQ